MRKSKLPELNCKEEMEPCIRVQKFSSKFSKVLLAYATIRLLLAVNPFLLVQDAECRAMGGARPTESDLDESSDDDLYASSDDDDEDEEEEEEEMDGAPSRHRLEWDNDL